MTVSALKGSSQPSLASRSQTTFHFMQLCVNSDMEPECPGLDPASSLAPSQLVFLICEAEVAITFHLPGQFKDSTQ